MAKISIGRTEQMHYDCVGDVLAINTHARKTSPSSGQSAGDVVIFHNPKTAEILGFETRIKGDIKRARELSTEKIFSKLGMLTQKQITLKMPEASLNLTGYDPESDVLHYSFPEHFIGKKYDTQTIWINPKAHPPTPPSFFSKLEKNKRLIKIEPNSKEAPGYTKIILKMPLLNKRKGVGVDLGKGVIIRYDPKTKEWLGLSLLNVSELIKKKQ